MVMGIGSITVFYYSPQSTRWEMTFPRSQQQPTSGRVNYNLALAPPQNATKVQAEVTSSSVEEVHKTRHSVAQVTNDLTTNLIRDAVGSHSCSIMKWKVYSEMRSSRSSRRRSSEAWNDDETVKALYVILKGKMRSTVHAHCTVLFVVGHFLGCTYMQSLKREIHESICVRRNGNKYWLLLWYIQFPDW